MGLQALKIIEEEQARFMEQDCAYTAKFNVNRVLDCITERIKAECVEIPDILLDLGDSAEETDENYFSGRRPHFVEEVVACAGEGCSICAGNVAMNAEIKRKVDEHREKECEFCKD